MANAARLIGAWERSSSGKLDRVQRALVEDVARLGPAAIMWEEGEGRRFARLELEGPADAPVLVCHFRAEVERPGLPLAFEWPLGGPRDALDYAVWMANLMELLDQAGVELPRTPGDDDIARMRAF